MEQKNLQQTEPSAWLEKWQKNAKPPANISEAIHGDQINVLAKREPDLLNVVLFKLFGDALEIRGASDNMISASVNVVKNEYPYLRVPEIAMVLNRGMSGAFGNVPSGAIPVLYWFKQYDEGERLDYFKTEALKHKEPYEKHHEESQRKEALNLKEEIKKQETWIKAKEIAQQKSAK